MGKKKKKRTRSPYSRDSVKLGHNDQEAVVHVTTLNFTVGIFVLCVSAGLGRGMIRECESALSALARYTGITIDGDQSQPTLPSRGKEKRGLFL